MAVITKNGITAGGITSSGIVGQTITTSGDDAFLYLPAKSSLIIQNYPATFARSGTATLEDHEGIVRTAKSGEARFWGARRVENMAANTDAPETQNITVISGRVYQVSIGAASAAGSTAVCSGAFTGTLTGDAVNRLAFDTPKTATTTTLTITITGAVKNLQVEDVTGQSIQHPGEYVSAGTLSTPFHGASVDGVKYFDYSNGNTVAVGIVTESQGAAIPAETLGGYYAEGSRINKFLQSQDFSNASWVKNDTVITANNAVSPEGTLTADLLTEGAAGTAYVLQATAITAGHVCYHSRTIKRGNHDWIRMVTANGADVSDCYFNLANGTIGAASNAGSATLATGRIKAMSNGFYRCTLISRISAGAISAFCSTTSAQGNGVPTRVKNSTRYEWNADFFSEAANPNFSFPSSVIFTTTATVTTGSDSLSLAMGAGNFPKNFTALFEYTPRYSNANLPDGSAYLGTFGTDDSRGADYEIRLYPSTGYSITTATGAVIININKADFVAGKCKFGLSVKQEITDTRVILIKDGVEKLNATAVLTLDHSNTGALEVGNYSTTRHAYGGIKNIRVYQQALDTDDIQRIMADYITNEYGDKISDENSDIIYTY